MPYEVQGPTPLLPALAGLASAYFNVKNELQQTKLEQQKAAQDAARNAQEISSSKTSQAATRAQYGLGQDDQPAPMPWDTTPPTAAAGKSGSAPQAPNLADPQTLMNDVALWESRANMSPPGSAAYNFAVQQRDFYKSMIPEAGKRFVFVKGPDGKPMLVGASDWYNKNTVPASTKYSQDQENKRRPMMAVKTPEGQTMFVPSSDVYNRETVPASTTYTQGQEWGRTRYIQGEENQRTAGRANKPSFGNLSSVLNEWSQGTQRQTGTDPVSRAPVFSRVPPTDAQRAAVYSAVDAIQKSPNPQRDAAAAITAYKRHFGDDPQVFHIFSAAAQVGGSNADANPPSPWP